MGVAPSVANEDAAAPPPQSPVSPKYGTNFPPAKPSNQYLVGCSCCRPKDEVKKQIVKQVNVTADPDGTERFYLAHEPPNLRRLTKDGQKIPLLFYCHGKQGSAWDSAMDETRWREKSKQGFFVVFGQARGPLFVHPTRAPGDEYGISGCFWQSIYPQDDVRYVDTVLQSVMGLFPGMIDVNRIYFMGFSSGGLFSYPLAIMLSHRFAAIVNYMGGVQECPEPGALPAPSDAKAHPPIFIITGSKDSHLGHCNSAKTLLEGAAFPVRFHVLPGREHGYHAEEVEPLAMAFCLEHALGPAQDRPAQSLASP